MAYGILVEAEIIMIASWVSVKRDVTANGIIKRCWKLGRFAIRVYFCFALNTGN